jgi:uridine kinase
MEATIRAVLAVAPRGRLTRIVAIDGHGGSGKSQLAEALSRRLGGTEVVHTDDFARPGVSGWEWTRMKAQVLEPLEADRPGRYQRYDWDDDRLAEWHDVAVGGTVIVEGVSSMREELGRYWDLAIWVECPYDTRLERGVARDGEEMRSQWTDVWMPEEDEYFRAQRPDRKADLIVDGTGP